MNKAPQIQRPRRKPPSSGRRATKLPRSKPVPAFNTRFAAALKHFGAALLESSAIKHTGSKGTAREEVVRSFLGKRLPSRYATAGGEAVDQFNVSSPQLDVMVFDQTRNFPLSDGTIHILPAEALLASVEVKSRLNTDEVRKSCDAARKLRMLRPFKVPLGGKNVGPIEQKNPRVARYLHCVFAYDTDLSQADWMKQEARRFKQHEVGSEHLVDCVYVLNRGLLNLKDRRGRVEDENGTAITSFYFSILNFIEREGGRRLDTPYQDYASVLSGSWTTLDVAPTNSAPAQPTRNP